MAPKNSAAKSRRRTVWCIRPTGLDPKKDAPFWRGDTAESVMRLRVREYARIAREKAERRKRSAAQRRRTNAAR